MTLFRRLYVRSCFRTFGPLFTSLECSDALFYIKNWHAHLHQLEGSSMKATVSPEQRHEATSLPCTCQRNRVHLLLPQRLRTREGMLAYIRSQVHLEPEHMLGGDVPVDIMGSNALSRAPLRLRWQCSMSGPGLQACASAPCDALVPVASSPRYECPRKRPSVRHTSSRTASPPPWHRASALPLASRAGT